MSKIARFTPPAPMLEQDSLGSITKDDPNANADDDAMSDVCYYLTNKDNDGLTFALPTKTRHTRRRAPKKLTWVHHDQAPVNNKLALYAYQKELIAKPALPMYNSFSPLRVMKKNATTAHIRAAGEILTTVSSVYRLRRMISKPNSKTVGDTVVAIHRVNMQLHHIKQRITRYYTPPAAKPSTLADAKTRLTYPV